MDFVALHRQDDATRPLIAIDGAELHAEKVLEQHRHFRQRGAGAVGTTRSSRSNKSFASRTPLLTLASSHG